MYKVQEVAKIAGVSVRTLHHYDSIGLMKPSNIGSNRYRYYNEEDLKLLQHILFFKELGFSLKKIQELVSAGFDANLALDQHIELLQKKKTRLEKLIENAERTKQDLAGDQTLSKEERFAAFSIKQPDDNINTYNKPVDAAEKSEAQIETEPDLKPEKEEEDLEEINREGNRIYTSVAALMHSSPENGDVQKEMHAYYTLLNRFYDCTPKMFRSLADLYASDSRFASNIDLHGAGLSAYLKEAMYVYAAGLQNG